MVVASVACLCFMVVSASLPSCPAKNDAEGREGARHTMFAACVGAKVRAVVHPLSRVIDNIVRLIDYVSACGPWLGCTAHGAATLRPLVEQHFVGPWREATNPGKTPHSTLEHFTIAAISPRHPLTQQHNTRMTTGLSRGKGSANSSPSQSSTKDKMSTGKRTLASLKDFTQAPNSRAALESLLYGDDVDYKGLRYVFKLCVHAWLG